MSRITRTLRRVPRAGWICFVVAFVNAAIWAVVVPPFQVPDEVTHFAYAQYLAETGKAPPQGTGTVYSDQEAAAQNYLLLLTVIGHVQQRGVFTPAEEQSFRKQVAQASTLSPLSGGGATNATNQPPLYYALAAIPYWLSPSHSLLGRLATMRLLSALLAAITVLAIFLFIRELLPGTPWAWVVGALAVAFQPQFNFIAAGVNGDNLLYTASALTLLTLVRTYKRGLTVRRGALIGGAVAIGLLSKLTYWGLTPGIALAVLLIAWRARISLGIPRTIKALAVTAAVALVPAALYGVLNVTVWNRGSLLAGGLGGTTATVHGAAITLAQTLSYIWQFYLPRLPFMHQTYVSNGAHGIWIDGFIGHFGWLDYTFPAWVYTYGQYVLYAAFVLACIACANRLRALRRWLPLIACFIVIGLGLVYEIGSAGIHYFLDTGAVFEQARYLFPLLALYGLMVSLAPRALPRRWAPALGAGLVILAMTHGLFALTLTISRYYG